MLASTDGLTRRVEIGRLFFRAVGAGKAVAIGTNSPRLAIGTCRVDRIDQALMPALVECGAHKTHKK